mmetsp:Transcript_16904/g.39041  ORF Transcript_16904/g.39041 Transcript_16904/m.39041 type:complete len:241 (-) Transcript_16904:236-958(-)
MRASFSFVRARESESVVFRSGRHSTIQSSRSRSRSRWIGGGAAADRAVQAPTLAANPCSFLRTMKMSRIFLVSSPPSAPSWVRSTILLTRCQLLSFSRSASMSSSFACSSSRFLAILASRFVEFLVWNSSMAIRAASTMAALSASSSSLRAASVACHSSLNCFIALGVSWNKTGGWGASSSSSTAGGGPSTMGASSATAGAPRRMGWLSSIISGAAANPIMPTPSSPPAGAAANPMSEGS